MTQPRTTDWDALYMVVAQLHPKETWTRECRVAQLHLTGSFELYLDIPGVHEHPVWIAYLRVGDEYRHALSCVYLHALCQGLLSRNISDELRAALFSMLTALSMGDDIHD